MSLYRIVQILGALPKNRVVPNLVKFALEVMEKEDEPKPLMSLYKMLILCQEPGMGMRMLGKQALHATTKVLDDPSQVDIGNMTARMRVQFIQALALNIKQRNMSSVETVILKFIENTQDDIISLDEKSVV